MPMSNIEAETIASTFFEHWICRFATPLKMTTDEERQFEANHCIQSAGKRPCTSTIKSSLDVPRRQQLEREPAGNRNARKIINDEIRYVFCDSVTGKGAWGIA